MADYGVSVVWGEAKVGREQAALDSWAATAATNDKAVSEGRLEAWDAAIFEANGEGPGGVLMFLGTQEQIEAFIATDEFQQNLLRASLALHGVGLRRFVRGDAMLTAFAGYAEIVAGL